MLRVERLTERYVDLKAVEGASFAVDGRELFGILSLNGLVRPRLPTKSKACFNLTQAFPLSWAWWHCLRKQVQEQNGVQRPPSSLTPSSPSAILKVRPHPRHSL